MLESTSTLTEQQINQLLSNGFVVLDNFLDADFYVALKTEAQHQAYRDAEITDGLEQTIRSDGIAWIDDKTPNQQHGIAFINRLQQLAEQFNRVLYAGIRRIEAHFARYASGKFYAKHVDNPKGASNRVFSCVFYMNDDWQENSGGELIIYLKNEQYQVLPCANRMVVFDSNLPHEVKPANRTRLSIAAWLRSDD